MDRGLVAALDERRSSLRDDAVREVRERPSGWALTVGDGRPWRMYPCLGRSDATRLRKAQRRKPYPAEPTYIYLKKLRELRGRKQSTLKALFRDKHADHRGRTHPIAWSSPYHADCLILYAPLRDETLLAPRIGAALIRGIKQVAVIGPDRADIEYQVDRIIIADGNDPSRFMATTSHKNMRDALRSCSRGCGVVRFCQLFI